MQYSVRFTTVIADLQSVVQVLWSILRWLPHSSKACVSPKSSISQDLVSLCFSIVPLFSSLFLLTPTFIQELFSLRLLMQRFLWIFHSHPILATLVIFQDPMCVISTSIVHHYSVFPKIGTFTLWEQFLCSSLLVVCNRCNLNVHTFSFFPSVSV